MQECKWMGQYEKKQRQAQNITVMLCISFFTSCCHSLTPILYSLYISHQLILHFVWGSQICLCRLYTSVSMASIVSQHCPLTVCLEIYIVNVIYRRSKPPHINICLCHGLRGLLWLMETNLVTKIHQKVSIRMSPMPIVYKITLCQYKRRQKHCYTLC